MRNRDSLLKKIIRNYTKNNINENGGKLIEPCNLHNLRITNTFFKHKPTHQTTWTSWAPYKNINNSKKEPLKEPLSQSDRLYSCKNCETIKITDLKSTTSKITMSHHKPVIMKTTIILKKHCKKRKIQQIDYRRLMNIANVQENYKSTISDRFNDINYEIINSQQKWNTITDILKESAKTNAWYVERSKRSEMLA